MSLTFCQLRVGYTTFYMIFEANKLKISMKNNIDKHAYLRDLALYTAYKEALASKKDVTHTEAIKIALKSPQPKLWVPFYGVYRALLHIVKGSRKTPKGPVRKKLLAEVERKYRMLITKRMFQGASLFFITSFIISEPSSGFYISEEYAKRIIWRVRKNRQAAWRKKS